MNRLISYENWYTNDVDSCVPEIPELHIEKAVRLGGGTDRSHSPAHLQICQ